MTHDNTIINGQASYNKTEADDGFRPTPYLRYQRSGWGRRYFIEQLWHNSDTGVDEWRELPVVART